MKHQLRMRRIHHERRSKHHRRIHHERRVKHHRRIHHERRMKHHRRIQHERRIKHHRRIHYERRAKQARRAPVVYQHCNFGGYRKVVRHSTNWVRRLGIKNDDLSSIKVPAGKCVILYQHAHYRGRSWKICGKTQVRCFVHHRMLWGKSWNDQVSSIRVINKYRL